VLVAGAAYVAVGVNGLELEEQLDDKADEFRGLMESPGIVVGQVLLEKPGLERHGSIEILSSKQ
jgi:hypothetical protein